MRALTLFSMMVVVLGIMSCATVGKKFDKSLMDNIEYGKTTRANIQAWFGEPQGRHTDERRLYGNGAVLGYDYVYSESAMFLGGYAEALTIEFDKDDLVVHKAYDNRRH